jgi:hypothetical protein
MKRTYRVIEPSGTVMCTIDGARVRLPLFGGILKHPTLDQLRVMLEDPVVVRRYVREALRKAPWNALRRFPRALLLDCMADADLTPGRRGALELLLGASSPDEKVVQPAPGRRLGALRAR